MGEQGFGVLQTGGVAGRLGADVMLGEAFLYCRLTQDALHKALSDAVPAGGGAVVFIIVAFAAPGAKQEFGRLCFTFHQGKLDSGL